MKYILSFVGVCLVAVSILFFKDNKEEVNEDYLRIYVSANSQTSKDEEIKYMVKDAVVDYLIPYLAFSKTKDEAKEVINENLAKINEVAKAVLSANDVDYGVKVSLNKEDVPLRVYDGLVVEEGVYDCLKIELGSSQGDDWWCVVFPAVCFVSSKKYENIEYISKIWEIINNVT